MFKSIIRLKARRFSIKPTNKKVKEVYFCMSNSVKFFGLLLSVMAMMLFARVAMSDESMAGMSHDHKSMSKSNTESKTITGEVIDVACYLEHDAKGDSHATCAADCISKGMPGGIMDAKGNLYIVMGEGHKTPADVLKGLAAKQVTATGKLVTKGGTNFIVVSKIVESKTNSKDSKSTDKKSEKNENEKTEKE